ncbi:MAG: dNDP-4-keto-6-deoxy-glucose-2,3- dehydratase [Ruminococcaceae bacterium]|jgi:oxidase EvaA|nr:dNDP-4-keto-6-deoxy-glucose-2,3- dehydratase [Oscillospiraceae bacterium]
MGNNSILALVRSWAEPEGKVYSTCEILEWVEDRNRETNVAIRKISPAEDNSWRYIEDEGIIANAQRSFFFISGFEHENVQQPILIQDEIGYLGILCKEIDGVLHLLMQAKIEPGNVNKIQISPTIQATKSNFTQKHGGTRPAYLDYFWEADKHEIIVDQIQSEQASRFLGKRNRNILIVVDKTVDIDVLPTHRWMTLGQIKQLMKHDNLVNMDTRTVLSCIPFHLGDPRAALPFFQDKALYRSIYFGNGINHLPNIYNYINNDRMFSGNKPRLIPLYNMKNWQWEKGEFVCKDGYHFKIVFCDIAIEGREVKRWTQPLFEAVGIATFGLLCCEVDGILRFVIKCKKEIGNFDGPELGPTLQLEADEQPRDDMERFFLSCYEQHRGICNDVILSEEGGRFYHEQNRNIILRLAADELPSLPKGYFMVDYRTLSMLVQVNNILNIQLRNLLSLLEV